ncbi:hypothetical protein EUGRSUZ_G00477 [Eucalyptus grandis]|uniref:Uncharacterized protein n=2 Tax=Eucalyptus grandis TaxID=71139 RepID=A0ACC3K307_EUCGR|nr:hypothetical protein EUGRSUZ_G00477 [Eucalyptus grandis]
MYFTYQYMQLMLFMITIVVYLAFHICLNKKHFLANFSKVKFCPHKAKVDYFLQHTMPYFCPALLLST